jgi:hypothetical protein
MTWRNFFIYRVNGNGQPPSGGAFITPQTLTSFLGASAVIGIVAKVYLEMVPGANSKYVGVIVALIIGMVIFIINVTDKQVKPPDLRSWFIAIVVGTINTIYLIAVTLGVFEAIP